VRRLDAPPELAPALCLEKPLKRDPAKAADRSRRASLSARRKHFQPKLGFAGVTMLP
jgi:hypothetical protein